MQVKTIKISVTSVFLKYIHGMEYYVQLSWGVQVDAWSQIQYFFFILLFPNELFSNECIVEPPSL